MYFQIRSDAIKWFSGIEKHFATRFDLYYLCFMAGLATGRKGSARTAEVSDLIDYYPKEFKGRGGLLVGLLLNAELENLGVDLRERADVRETMRELLDPNSSSHLGDKGVRLMNEYASGGFDFLCECFNDRPRIIETFVRGYVASIGKAAGAT